MSGEQGEKRKRDVTRYETQTPVFRNNTGILHDFTKAIFYFLNITQFHRTCINTTSLMVK